MIKKSSSKLDQCPICGSIDTCELYPKNLDIRKLVFTYEFSPESQKTFRVVRCRNCTHVFCSPLPKDIYKNYKDVIDKEYLCHTKTRKLSAKVVLDIIKSYIPLGKMLDVGCATGDFLEVARDSGYAVEGLELSHWSSEIARKKEIIVHESRLRDLTLKFQAKFDVITMWGVIEHFQDPFSEINYINKLLKPDGILAIWTGNVDGAMSRILGRRWWYWQGQHIQYFTYSSLNYLLEHVGFEHIVTKSYPIAASYEQVDNSLRRYKFRPYISFLIKILFNLRPIWYLRLPGEMLWIGRKKI